MKERHPILWRLGEPPRRVPSPTIAEPAVIIRLVTPTNLTFKITVQSWASPRWAKPIQHATPAPAPYSS